MEKSNLVELLKTMTVKELDAFYLFADSPYFSRGRYRKEALILLKILIKLAPNFEHSKLSKEKTFSEVFPGEVFTFGRIDKVMGEITKLLRQFLLTEHYLGEAQYQQAQIAYADLLNQRKLQQRSYLTIKAVMESIASKPNKNAADYELLFKSSYLVVHLESITTTWKDDLSIMKTIGYLDRMFYTNRLLLLNVFLSINKVSRLETTFDLNREREIVNFFEVAKEDSVTTYILQKIFRIYSETDSSISQFEDLFEILKENEHQIEEESLQHYFAFLRNYCTFLIQQGNTEIVFVLHEIHKDNLSKGYFLYLDKLSAGAFLSIATIALKANKFEWAKNFIEEYKDRIMGDNETKDIYRLTLAKYLFYISHFQEALDVLPVSSQKIDAHYSAKEIEVRIYYELGSDLLEYKIDSMKMYLSRASKTMLSDDMKEYYTNFINFITQIVRSKPGDKKRGEQIIQRINEKKRVAAIEWLIEKARELE